MFRVRLAAFINHGYSVPINKTNNWPYEIYCFRKIFYLYQLYLIKFYDGKSQTFTGNDPVHC